MKRGFWTVVEECIGRQPKDAREAIGVDLGLIEAWFANDDEWKAVALPPCWADILVQEGFQSTDFPWRVARAGTKLRFMPK